MPLFSSMKGGVIVNLTEKQKRFCDYYIETTNATESAIRAGYSKKTSYAIGQENLKKLEIKQYISERLSAKEDERIASQDEVLRYLTSIMRMEKTEEVIVVEGIGDGCSEAKIIEKRVSIKDANKAAELLAKRYGLLKESIDITGNIGVTIVDDVK